ncbi:hypothetical protein [Thalassospira sp. CH_XMU1458]|uniref:hypothetical protein n=1 Tax=Thalassospira sp. CH_XMU1458 TaxID=3107776 RepID=UPI00300C1010
MDDIIKRQLAIEERLDQIQQEQEREKGLISRLSKAGGLIALILSIAAGAYSLYDIAFLSDRKALSQDLIRLDSIAKDLVQANKDAINLNLSGQSEAAMTLNLMKISMTDRAKEIIDLRKEHISAPILTTIALELINNGDYTTGVQYLEIASNKFKNPFLKLETNRQKAYGFYSSMLPLEIEKGRKLFSDTLEQSKALKGTQAFWVQSNSIRDWVQAEAMIGECEMAREAAENFRPLLLNQTSHREAASGLITALKTVDLDGLCPRTSFRDLHNLIDVRLQSAIHN